MRKGKKQGVSKKKKDGAPNAEGIRWEGARRHLMALIAKRPRAIGTIGVIVSITWHQDVRGAIPRDGTEVRNPKVRQSSYAILLFDSYGHPSFGLEGGKYWKRRDRG